MSLKEDEGVKVLEPRMFLTPLLRFVLFRGSNVAKGLGLQRDSRVCMNGVFKVLETIPSSPLFLSLFQLSKPSLSLSFPPFLPLLSLTLSLYVCT